MAEPETVLLSSLFEGYVEGEWGKVDTFTDDEIETIKYGVHWFLVHLISETAASSNDPHLLELLDHWDPVADDVPLGLVAMLKHGGLVFADDAPGCAD